MNDWYSSVYKAFIVTSVISFAIGLCTTAATSLGAYMAGYAVLTLAILMMLMVLLNGAQSLVAMWSATGPFVAMLAVVTFVLYLSIKYQHNIVEDKVAPGYSAFSNVIVLLLLTQLYVIYSAEGFPATGKLPRVTSSVVYLLGTVNGICAVILYTILKYYSTDGFRS